MWVYLDWARCRTQCLKTSHHLEACSAWHHNSLNWPSFVPCHLLPTGWVAVYLATARTRRRVFSNNHFLGAQVTSKTRRMTNSSLITTNKTVYSPIMKAKTLVSVNQYLQTKMITKWWVLVASLKWVAFSVLTKWCRMMVDLERWMEEKECSRCKMYSSRLKLEGAVCQY